jgi:hypothetical protein
MHRGVVVTQANSTSCRWPGLSREGSGFLFAPGVEPAGRVTRPLALALDSSFLTAVDTVPDPDGCTGNDSQDVSARPDVILERSPYSIL